MNAVVISCFAWIGYAIGGILSATIARIEIDYAAAGSDLKIQMMFVIAFIFNVIFVFYISKKWLKSKFSLLFIFLSFWLIDTLVPILYQLIFTYPSPIHLALLLGFFPAVIITLGIRSSGNRLKQIID